MKKKTALITGVTGQDGAYLAEYLLSHDYHVIGLVRRTSSLSNWRLKELGISEHPSLTLISGDLTDLSDLVRIVETAQPDEVYNLAAQSFVGVSFDQPFTTADITAIGAHRVIEAIRIAKPNTRFYQASSSEMFGKVQAIPQTESTPFYPRSPYGVSKLYAHWITVNYRESYHMFAASGILFNHESPLRGKEFVTRKITDAVARIKLGVQSHLELGNLDAKRDWGYAKDYVVGMHKMLQCETPDTFVLATGRMETVRLFVEMAFKAAGITIEWKGQGVDETGHDAKTGIMRIKINPVFYRPAEVDLLIGDPAKSKSLLNWEPTTRLNELCELMVAADLNRVTAEIQAAVA